MPIPFGMLHYLEALLEHRSVSKAAEVLGISAPAMSRALQRCRDAVGDALLVRTGNAMVLTPRAEEIAHELRVHLGALRVSLGPRRAGRVRADRTLRIRGDTSVALVLAAPLARHLAQRVDDADVAFLAEGEEDVESTREGRVDLDVGSMDATSAEVRQRFLFEDEMVGVAARVAAGDSRPSVSGRDSVDPASARALSQEWSLECFCAIGHVAVSRRGIPSGPIDAALGGLGVARRIEACVPDYVTAAFLAAEMGLVTYAPRVVARWLERRLDLRVFRLPFDVPPIRIGMSWHARMQEDPLHVALRQSVVDASADIAVLDRRDAL